MARRPLFDPSKLPSRRQGAPDRADAAPQPLTVAALVARIKGALSAAFAGPVTVVGELSNVKIHTSGHVYFSLKDASACINAAMFRSAASRLKFTPADGLEVVVEGRVDVYDARGQLQLYVERMTPRGQGALELAFRQLCQKLQQEGLFDPAHKTPLPKVPRAVGVITSPTGAAVRDVRRTLVRRWPAATMYLLPVPVQGPGAAQDIARAIAAMDAAAERLGIDTIILARGGGSLEDLWAFNEEVVARAIFACRTPIISGVGHEVDVTVSDMVADVRAATPTAAAELAVPDRAETARALHATVERLRRSVTVHLRHAGSALDACMRSVVFRDPRSRLRVRVQQTDELAHRLRSGVRHLLAAARERLGPLSAGVASAHPARVLERKKANVASAQAALRWALGGRAKRAGDTLAGAAGRLAAAHPRHRLALAIQRVTAAARHLEAMSYRSVLARGFSVTRGGDGQIMRSSRQARIGQRIQTELADGRIASDVVAQDAGDTDAPPPAKRPLAQRKRRDNGPTLF